MKNTPYIRHVLILLWFVVLWVVNFFVAPALFILGQARKTIERTIEGKVNFWSWFINTDEPTVKENMYGDAKYLAKRKITDIESRNFFVRFWWFWIWNVVRNSFFYYKLHVLIPIPKKVDEKDIRNIKNTSNKGDMKWLTWGDNGTIHTEYPIYRDKENYPNEKTEYFRYSQVKIVNYLFWKGTRKMQFGASGIEDKNRYIFKLNHRKL